MPPEVQSKLEITIARIFAEIQVGSPR
jgi:hypothetical protein